MRRPADAEPDRQRILYGPRIDALPGQGGTVLARPLHVLIRANVQQQIEFFGKQLVVVFQSEAEEWKRFDGRAAADDHLRAAPGQQVERGEVLKRAHGVLGAQHRDRAGQTNALRPCRGGAENDGRSRVQELASVVLANAKRVQADLVGMFDLLD